MTLPNTTVSSDFGIPSNTPFANAQTTHYAPSNTKHQFHHAAARLKNKRQLEMLQVIGNNTLTRFMPQPVQILQQN